MTDSVGYVESVNRVQQSQQTKERVPKYIAYDLPIVDERPFVFRSQLCILNSTLFILDTLTPVPTVYSVCLISCPSYQEPTLDRV